MFYVTVFQLLNIIVPLITTPYISRVLGPEGVGINAYTLSITTYFVLAGSLGIQLYGNREIAYYQGNKEKKSQIFFELVILKVIAISLSTIIYLIFSIFQGNYTNYFLIQGFALLAAALDISWYFMGVENFRILVIRNTVIKVIVLGLTFILVKQEADLWIYILLTAASPVLGNLTVWPFLRTELVKVRLKSLNMIRHLKPALLLFLPQITMSIYLSLNKTMLGVMVDIKSAGYYSQSDMIIRSAFTLVSSFAGAFLPRLSSLFSEEKYEEIKNLTLKSFDLSIFLSVLIMSGIMAVSNKFAVVFFGERFEIVGALMSVQSLMILFVSFAVVSGSQYLLAAKRTKEYAISAVLGLIVNVLFNFILIPFLGAMGAIISTVLTEFIVAVYQLWVIRDVFSIREILRGVWKYLVGGTIVFVVVHTLSINMPGKFIYFVVQALVGVLIYISVILLLKASIISEMKGILLLKKDRGN